MEIVVNPLEKKTISIPDEYVLSNGQIDLKKLNEIKDPILTKSIEFWFQELVYYNYEVLNTTIKQLKSISNKSSALNFSNETIYDKKREEARRIHGMGLEPDWELYDYICERELNEKGIDPYAGLI